MTPARTHRLTLILCFPLAVAPLARSAPQAEAAELLGVADLFTGCGTSLSFSSADYSLALTPAPVLYRAIVTAANMGALSGQTTVLDAEDGARFFQAVELLTNGVSDVLVSRIDIGNGSQEALCFRSSSETQFFDFVGLACPNGIDFAGATIERLELRIDSLAFGPSYLGLSSLLVHGELSVYGHDPAPCLPPRFQVRLQPGAPLGSALLTAREEGDGSEGDRWRLWVEHRVEQVEQGAALAGTPAEPLADLVLVSRRALELPLAIGTLLCDPSPDALVLWRILAPGQPVELALPPSSGTLDALHAQALTLDMRGRLRLTDGRMLATARR